MKKTLIASAVAATLASVVPFSVMAAGVDLYGNVQLAMEHTDDEATSSHRMFDNGSTLGVKGSHEIAPGIKGFFKAEMEFRADDKATSTGLSKLDEAYIGIEGDQFGKVWAGSDDTVYETSVNVLDYFEAVGMGGNYGTTGEGDMIQYSSPSFSGLRLHAGVMINAEDNSDPVTAARKDNLPYVLAATFDLSESTTLGFGIDSNDAGLLGDNKNAYGVSLIHSMGDIGVRAQIETREDAQTLYGAMGTYAMGRNVFALAYQFVKDESNAGADQNAIAVQALNNLSDNLYVYVEGQWVDVDKGAETKTAVIGATYAF